jgi:hypothetical protein
MVLDEVLSSEGLNVACDVQLHKDKEDDMFVLQEEKIIKWGIFILGEAVKDNSAQGGVVMDTAAQDK